MSHFNRFWNESWATSLLIQNGYVLLEGFGWTRLFFSIVWFHYTIFGKHHIVTESRKSLRCRLFRSTNTQIKNLIIWLSLFIWFFRLLILAFLLDCFRLKKGLLSWLIVVLSEGTFRLLLRNILLLKVWRSSYLILYTISHFKAVVNRTLNRFLVLTLNVLFVHLTYFNLQ